MKTQLVSGLLRASAWWLQQGSIPLGKRFLWDRVCAPHLVWRNCEMIATTKAGFKVLAHPNEFQEGRLLFFGVWEPTVTALFHKVLEPGDVVLDVGANLGYFTLLSSQIVGREGHVFAVEPSPWNRRRLEANLALNKIGNVTVVPCAAWDKAGVGQLHTSAEDTGSGSLRAIPGAIRHEDVPLAPLDEVIPAEVWPRVKLIKIDVEGAEYKALLGLRAIIEAAADVKIICEVSPHKASPLGGSAAPVLNLMQGHAFAAYELVNDYTPEGYISPSQPAGRPLIEPPAEETYVLFRRDRDGETAGPKRTLVEHGLSSGAGTPWVHH